MTDDTSIEKSLEFIGEALNDISGQGNGASDYIFISPTETLYIGYYAGKEIAIERLVAWKINQFTGQNVRPVCVNSGVIEGRFSVDRTTQVASHRSKLA